MKWLLIGIVVLVLVGVIGVVGLQYVSNKQTPAPAVQTSVSVTKTGVLQPLKGDDYSYAILSEGKFLGVNSFTVKLQDYVGKNVQITGQYSGTTLYADTVTIVP